jgi:hypothetical protein
MGTIASVIYMHPSKAAPVELVYHHQGRPNSCKGCHADEPPYLGHATIHGWNGMMRKHLISCRRFLQASAAVDITVGRGNATFASPTLVVPRCVLPVVIAVANGHKYRNGRPRTCVEEVFAPVIKVDAVHDELIARVNFLELASRRQRRLRRPAQCRVRGAVRCLVHARPPTREWTPCGASSATP